MKKFFKTLFSLLALLLIAGMLFLYWPLHQRTVPPAENEQPLDAVLIGGGIMSVTLATYLQELEPGWKVQLFERLDGVALESSNGWNNAGTGHSGFAELNYTPQQPDGSVAADRAVGIAEQFEISRQFWAHLVQQGRLVDPGSFINATPHMSFVWGDDNIEFLRKRHAVLVENPLFYGMEYSEDPAQIRQWAPLLMEGRDPQQKVAATWMPLGTDVNFGVITQQLTGALQRNPDFELQLRHEVRALRQNDDKTWNVTVYDLASETERTVRSRFVFIGAGGASLKLLQLSGIPEARNYAGFPVGGQFLALESSAITSRHNAKAYGMAETGAPPMSVPHLDTRVLDGKQVVLFGPFALYSSKFLKHGSWFDLYSSVNQHNVLGMLDVGAHHLDLVRYLVEQAILTDDDRHAELLKYFPNARPEDWRLVTAGQRVQVIKNDPQQGPVLQFGTEIVTDQHGSIAALLGASPGASTSPPIMLTVLSRSFPQEMASRWEARLRDIIPSYGQKLNASAELTNAVRRQTSQALQLPHVEVPTQPNQAFPAAPAANDPSLAPSPATPGTPARNLEPELQAL